VTVGEAFEKSFFPQLRGEAEKEQLMLIDRAMVDGESAAIAGPYSKQFDVLYLKSVCMSFATFTLSRRIYVDKLDFLNLC
jgi:hypothetical protein